MREWAAQRMGGGGRWDFRGFRVLRVFRDFRDLRDLRVFRVFRVFREAFGVSQKKRTFALIKDSEYFFSEDSEDFF